MNKNDKSSADETESFEKGLSLPHAGVCSRLLSFFFHKKKTANTKVREKSTLSSTTQHKQANKLYFSKTQNTFADSQSAKRNNPLLPRSLYQ